MKPINILLYEDSDVYRDSFKLLAQKKRIIVDAVDNVDELLEMLNNSRRKHKFVVLDGRAYLHEGQTGNTQTEANLHKIIREISIIEKAQDRVIPYCVNTGFADVKMNHKDVLECEIFEKGNEENLFEYIWRCYNNSDGAKLRADYPEIFDFADAYFNDANLEVLCKFLNNKNFESSRVADRVDNLSRLRRLNEHLMDIYREMYLGTELSVITTNAGKRSVEIIDYARNVAKEQVPGHIINSVKNIYYTGSEFGSHSTEQAESIADYPTHDTIIGMTHSFFGTVLWLKNKLK